MSNASVSILILTYSIRFNDADNGYCCAGDGQRIISVHQNKTDACALAETFNPVLVLAEKETTVFPVQANNRKLKNQFGFTTDDIDDGYNFKLEVVDFDVLGDNANN